MYRLVQAITFFPKLIYRRYVENSTLFADIGKAARSVPGARLALGGNAPAMARRMAMEGADILLAARFTEQTRKTLPDTIKGSLVKLLTNKWIIKIQKSTYM